MKHRPTYTVVVPFSRVGVNPGPRAIPRGIARATELRDRDRGYLVRAYPKQRP